MPTGSGSTGRVRPTAAFTAVDTNPDPQDATSIQPASRRRRRTANTAANTVAASRNTSGAKTVLTAASTVTSSGWPTASR